MNAPERALAGPGLEESTQREAGLPDAPRTDAQAPADGLEALRRILVDPERARVAQLEAQVAELDVRTGDRDALIATITPVLGDVMRQKIRDSRDEMIEALYPIIGQLIGRAVAEAIRDLARTIDTRMRTSFSPQTLGRRLRARMAGVPESALTLRDALPFRVSELFLIHRDSGLLLRYLPSEPETGADSDLISGMLTAIRDFTHEAFGRGQEGQLDEIQYGTRRILIEASRHAYLAVVVDGIEPHGFRGVVRDRIIAFENAYTAALAGYNGDAAQFAPADPALATLLIGSDQVETTSQASPTGRQRQIIIGLGALLALCVLAACAGSMLTVRKALDRPVTAIQIVVTTTPGPTAPPSPTATVTPTATASPLPTATASPTASPTVSPRPTATASATATPQPTATPTPTSIPVAQVNVPSLNIRQGPGITYAVLEITQTGRTYRIVGRDASNRWWQVCCTTRGDTGWLASALTTVRGDTAQVAIVSGP